MVAARKRAGEIFWQKVASIANILKAGDGETGDKGTERQVTR
jgi:hypothetical protein